MFLLKDLKGVYVMQLFSHTLTMCVWSGIQISIRNIETNS